MKILLLSDIHSNIEALQAVLQAANAPSFDAIWVLGDVTGYGPDPSACLETLRSLPVVRFIRGNHDRVVGRVTTPMGFNSHAIHAASKNMSLLTDEQKSWLGALPETLKVSPDILLVHGSPLDPDEYLLTLGSAIPSLLWMNTENTRMVFFGHTHIPSLYEFDTCESQFLESEINPGEDILLDPSGSRRYLINPGSVGQPRDGNPQAAYAVLLQETDTARITFGRVDYPIEAVQEKMRRQEFPDLLIKRLKIGF